MKTRYISSYVDMFAKSGENIPPRVYPELLSTLTDLCKSYKKMPFKCRRLLVDGQ